MNALHRYCLKTILKAFPAMIIIVAVVVGIVVLVDPQTWPEMIWEIPLGFGILIVSTWQEASKKFQVENPNWLEDQWR